VAIRRSSSFRADQLQQIITQSSNTGANGQIVSNPTNLNTTQGQQFTAQAQPTYVWNGYGWVNSQQPQQQGNFNTTPSYGTYTVPNNGYVVYGGDGCGGGNCGTCNSCGSGNSCGSSGCGFSSYSGGYGSCGNSCGNSSSCGSYGGGGKHGGKCRGGKCR
jgi:hypothetical protein